MFFYYRLSLKISRHGQPRSIECLHRSLRSLPSCQIIRLKDVSQETNNTSQSRGTTKNVLWTGTTSEKWLRRSRNGRGGRDYCSGGTLICCWGRSNGGERRGSSSGGSRRGRSRRLSSARAVSSRKSDTVLLGTRLRIKTLRKSSVWDLGREFLIFQLTLGQQ